MSDSYTKLFASITESTIWSEPAGTRLVWITMLAKSNRHGEVFGSVPGLARLANVTMQECETAIAALLGPDRWSRTKEHDGRRIAPIDGGWRILNHAKFDRLRSEIESEERERERKREWDRANRPSGHARSRAARQSDDSPMKSDVGPSKSVPPPTPALSKSEEQKQQRDSRRGARLPDDWQPSEAVREWARKEFPAVSLSAALDEFRDHWKAVPGSKGCKLDWDATFRNRIRQLGERVFNANRKRGGSGSAVDQVQAAIDARHRG